MISIRTGARRGVPALKQLSPYRCEIGASVGKTPTGDKFFARLHSCKVNSNIQMQVSVMAGDP
jgi:hypothetical protein